MCAYVEERSSKNKHDAYLYISRVFEFVRRRGRSGMGSRSGRMCIGECVPRRQWTSSEIKVDRRRLKPEKNVTNSCFAIFAMYCDEGIILLFFRKIALEYILNGIPLIIEPRNSSEENLFPATQYKPPRVKDATATRH